MVFDPEQWDDHLTEAFDFPRVAGDFWDSQVCLCACTLIERNAKGRVHDRVAMLVLAVRFHAGYFMSGGEVARVKVWARGHDWYVMRAL